MALHKASRNLLRKLLRNPVEPDLPPHQSLPDLLRNLSETALHQSLPGLLRNLLYGTRLPGTFSGTFSGNFSGTLLNLTCLRTKASQTFSGTSPKRLCTKASQAFSGTCYTEPGFLEPSPEPSPEPCPEPCWTWPGSAPKLPRPSPEPSLKPCWTWLGSAPPH